MHWRGGSSPVLRPARPRRGAAAAAAADCRHGRRCDRARRCVRRPGRKLPARAEGRASGAAAADPAAAAAGAPCRAPTAGDDARRRVGHCGYDAGTRDAGAELHRCSGAASRRARADAGAAGRRLRRLVTATASFPALGTTAFVVVTEPSRLSRARAAVEAELARVDLACSRFRADSELSRAQRGRGRRGACRPAAARGAARSRSRRRGRRRTASSTRRSAGRCGSPATTGRSGSSRARDGDSLRGAVRAGARLAGGRARPGALDPCGCPRASSSTSARPRRRSRPTAPHARRRRRPGAACSSRSAATSSSPASRPRRAGRSASPTTTRPPLDGAGPTVALVGRRASPPPARRCAAGARADAELHHVDRPAHRPAGPDAVADGHGRGGHVRRREHGEHRGARARRATAPAWLERARACPARLVRATATRTCVAGWPEEAA